MVGPPLRPYLAAARNTRLAGAGTATGSGEHPVCGDLVEVDVRLAGVDPAGGTGAATIAAVACRVDGCPAAVAVAALAVEFLPGIGAQEAAGRLAARLGELGGLAAHEHHAVAMVQRALAVAIANAAAIGAAAADERDEGDRRRPGG